MGRDATLEETALALIALKGCRTPSEAGVAQGLEWLENRLRQGTPRPAAIGLYFSLLWYHEKMYPLAWPLEALAECAP